MKVRLKPGLVVVTGESDEERRSLADWAKDVDGHVFALKLQDGQTFRLSDLGSRAEACNEPINVTSSAADANLRLISNFAHTPFELDGKQYASVEAFWQGLKFADERRRREIALLHGGAARRAGIEAPAAVTFEYAGQSFRVGTIDHWRLMERACREKFSQHDSARSALLGTGERPLVHKTRKDSQTIPGVIMAEIWMRIRRRLARGKSASF